MTVATSTVGLGASVVAVAAGGAFLATALGHRSEPTARPVIGIAVALLVGAILHLAVVDLRPVRDALGIAWGPTESAGGFWTLIAFDLPALVGVFWFLFALQYTGRDRETTPVALSVVGVLVVLLVGPNVALAAIGTVLEVPASTLNTVLGITIVLSESLALIGVFLVVAATLGRKAFPAGQTALLAAAVGAILALPFVATTLQRPATTPVAVAGSALLFTAAIRRYRVFETLPVASVVGRDRVIDEMSEGVVVVGSAGRIRDLNPEGAAVLGADRSAAVGDSLEAVAPELPDPGAVAGAGPRDVHTDSGRIVTVSADPVTDDRGRELGHLLVCRDVTETRRRERRLAVLTQLVAGATTERMGTVEDVAADVIAGDRTPADGGERVLAAATETATLVARVRRVERALAERSGGTAVTDVGGLLADLRVPDDVAVCRPDGGADLHVRAEPSLLSATLETLAAGAAAGDSAVELRASREGAAVLVEVAPFAPGDGGSIPTLALEVARLAADHADWRLDTATDSGESVAVLRLPAVGGSRDHTGGEPE
jgi:PAS domain-containing protein